MILNLISFTKEYTVYDFNLLTLRHLVAQLVVHLSDCFTHNWKNVFSAFFIVINVNYAKLVECIVQVFCIPSDSSV